MKNKLTRLITIILLITLTIPIVLGATTPITPPNLNPAISDLTGNEATQNAIIREHLRTRTELKTYMDSKITEATNTFKTDGQKFIDENFKVLDQRMQELATKFLIKTSIAIIVCIVLAHAIWYYIYRVLIKKENRRPKTITQDVLNQKAHGLMHEEFKKKIEKEQNIQYATKPVQDYGKKEPTPPTVEMIEKQLLAQKKQQTTKSEPKTGFFKKVFTKKNKPITTTTPIPMEEIPPTRPTINQTEIAEKALKEEIKRLNQEYENPTIEVYENKKLETKSLNNSKKSPTIQELNLQLEEINKKLKQLESNA